MTAAERENAMRLALSLAADAADCGEVPVGCVITDKNGTVIGCGRNRTRERADATAHAEIEAIREACRALGDWRLEGCTLSVTLEPCPMCAGAIMSARIPTVVYGARDSVKGACGSVIDLFSENFPEKCAVFANVFPEESSALLSGFFKTVREGESV